MGRPWKSMNFCAEKPLYTFLDNHQILQKHFIKWSDGEWMYIPNTKHPSPNIPGAPVGSCCTIPLEALAVGHLGLVMFQPIWRTLFDLEIFPTWGWKICRAVYNHRLLDHDDPYSTTSRFIHHHNIICGSFSLKFRGLEEPNVAHIHCCQSTLFALKNSASRLLPPQLSQNSTTAVRLSRLTKYVNTNMSVCMYARILNRSIMCVCV